jgi:hypothetical protein
MSRVCRRVSYTVKVHVFTQRDPQHFFPMLQQSPSWVGGNGVGFSRSTAGRGLLVGWRWGLAQAVGPGGTQHDRLETVFHTAVATAEKAFRAAVLHRWLRALALTLDSHPGTGRSTGTAVRLAIDTANGIVDGRADASGTGLFGVSLTCTCQVVCFSCSSQPIETTCTRSAGGSGPPFPAFLCSCLCASLPGLNPPVFVYTHNCATVVHRTRHASSFSFLPA